MRNPEWRNILRSSVIFTISVLGIFIFLLKDLVEYGFLVLANTPRFTIPFLIAFGAIVGSLLSKRQNSFSRQKQQENQTNNFAMSVCKRENYPNHEFHQYQQLIEKEIWKLENIRSWISYELHEDIAQILVAAKNHLQIDLLRKSPVSSQIEKAGNILEQAIKKVNILYEKLEVPPLHLLGLIPCLQQKIEEENKFGSTEIIFIKKKVCFEHLEEAVKLIIYRIISEKINNINKHSKAKNAWIEIDLMNEEIKLNVIDDGIGFYNSERQWKNGLQMIRAMISSVGGTFYIKSAPGRGCEFNALIPAKKAPSLKTSFADLNHSINAFDHL
jgi:signal transduction histidine kinase